jgi:hypothetical protein
MSKRIEADNRSLETQHSRELFVLIMVSVFVVCLIGELITNAGMGG